MNRYIAVLVASKEARRINELLSKEEKELTEKPTVRALKRLSDEKLKAETPEE
jgi:DNA-directed RNA polymerase subunit K/omega